MPTVISIENLSKSYRLGTIGTGLLTYDLNRWWARVRKQPDPYLRIGQEDRSHRDGELIWALRDINLQVQQGEALGIIGRNGAGKSTLLKILSRVTAPTTGAVKVKGRIASLLEVGTGFHPELTGRENIYLNGAIFGMTRAEVTRKLDEIIDFSGVEKYIDTPVKRYSSGMYVRLAFAVAAHLDPEILIVDEVLAVGDAEFQKKCLGKMGDVAGEGRTVLFVSHNMAAIQTLCPLSILLDKGTIIDIGISRHVIKKYLGSSKQTHTNAFLINSNEIKIEKFEIYQTDVFDTHLFVTTKEIIIEYQYFIKKEVGGLRIGFDIFTIDGILLLRTFDDEISGSIRRKPGTYKSKCTIPSLFFSPIKYFVIPRLTIHRSKWLYKEDDGIEIEFFNDNGVNSKFDDQLPGAIMPRFDWEITYK